ncbi:regulatory protein LysR [Methylorubrum populi]|uniref:Regulatory protein LysR n=1 Tax=Methylorubrum populi TaxID=223967 RepID=A0A169QG94_9HYPH|nr:substrate-binding domain-containing protein [Methylorubrum populi]BAU88855.1 regulatory protein LysR [Methylorubrum populi]
MNDSCDASNMKLNSVAVALGLGGTVRVGANTVAVSDLMVVFEAIARTGSVQGFADALGLSYRAAWARLQTYEVALGRPLVHKTRGHGTALTGFGASLAEALAAAAGGLEAGLLRETRAVEHRLRELLTGRAGVFTLAASHDPLLVEVLGELGGFEMSVMGSRAAVERLLGGGVDVAGFHCGARGPGAAGPPFSSIDAAGLALHPLFEREQGLLLAPGNPHGIRSLTDLTAEGVRYVNRQKGSGTRDWFDRMLAEAGLPASAIHGYAVEEFTHQAVAAVIACGAADAGLGVRASAERLGLDFLSIGWETYYLAASRSLAASALDDLIAAVRAGAGRMSGYRPGAASAEQAAGDRL